MTSAFFYGTLMHPKILKRVIGHDGSQLQIRPALLLDYTRHRVKDEDYPGIVPYSQSRVFFSDELAPGERCVRGSLVTGLSDRDMKMLDIFEEDEYTWEPVRVFQLGPPVSLHDMETAVIAPPPDELTSPLEAHTYVWPTLSGLEPTLWSFEEFVRESAWKWIGPGAEDNERYTELDKLPADGVRLSDS